MVNEKIASYTGINIAKKLKGTARELYLKNLEYMHEAFGDNVEYERHTTQILYCRQTRDFLYSAPQKPTYSVGTRPILEQAVSDACKGCVNDWE